MNILIVGASGQIGHAMTLALAQTEHRVSVLLRSAASQDFPSRVHVLEHAEFTPEVFSAALRDVDHVIYAVGMPEQFVFDSSIFAAVNCGLLKTFLEALRNSPLRRLTYVSTYEVFELVDGVIEETHAIADESHMTPYFQSMIRAYRIAAEFARENAVQMTTIHPAAVYGGLNTGGGITDYMENLAARNWHRVPFINPSSFPVAHVSSLAEAVIKSLDTPGAFIVSDQMTTLKDIALAMRAQARSYVPLVMPMWLVMLGIAILETIAKIFRVKPIASAVQIDFLTKGWKPSPAKAIRDLGWQPMPLQEGIRRFLSARTAAGPARPRALAHAGDAARIARLRTIGRLELLTGAGLVLYWVLYFTVGIAPDDPPPGYFVFQNSFTVADIILALVFMRAGRFLLSDDPAERASGSGLSLICAGAALFLGGLDVSFNVQNNIYTTLSIDTVMEIAINVWCLGFGLLLVFEFVSDARRNLQ